MSNYKWLKERCDAKGAKMVWNVDWGSPFNNSIHSTLFLTEEEAKEYFDSFSEGYYKKMYPVEDIWNFTRKQELLKELEEAKAAGDVRWENSTRYMLAKEFGWHGK